jgi:hypothetical protein
MNYGGLLSNQFNICEDAPNPEIWETFKREFGERYDEQYLRETMAYRNNIII